MSFWLSSVSASANTCQSTVQPTPVATPVENMITEQDIPANMELFTAYLGSWRDTADTDKGESFYTFG